MIIQVFPGDDKWADGLTLPPGFYKVPDMEMAGFLNADQIVRCSQHGFRGTPRCNDNDACSLQAGVFVPGEREH